MDLMDVSLTLLVPTNLCREQQRMSYSSGYQNALYSVVRHNKQALLLEEGKEDCLDLDNTIVWRQIKVKQKAIQLFRLLEGQAVEAKILRIGLKTLIRDGYVYSGQTGNLYLALRNAGYSRGTSSAQTNQMITLFQLLRMTKENGYKWQINPSSLILKRIIAMNLHA